MGLTMTRPEKERAMIELVDNVRNLIASEAQANGLNIAEVVNATAQVFTSLLVGAYDHKNREIVIMGLPDLIRAYYPQWEKIYAEFQATERA